MSSHSGGARRQPAAVASVTTSVRAPTGDKSQARAYEQRARQYERQAAQIEQRAGIKSSEDDWHAMVQASNARGELHRLEQGLDMMEWRVRTTPGTGGSLSEWRDIAHGNEEEAQRRWAEAKADEQAKLEQAKSELATTRARIAVLRSDITRLDQRETEAKAGVKAARNARMRAAVAYARADAARGGRGAVILYDNRSAVDAAQRVMGHSVSRDALATLVGARRGERVAVTAGDEGRSFHVSLESKTHSVSQDVTRTRAGIELSQSSVRVMNRTAASGRELIDTFKQLRDIGIAKLTATAARGNDMNGYYTWARLGFTGKIPEHVLGAAQARFGRSVTTVQQVMAKDGGPQWWKQHGDDWQATFDFRRGSYSNKQLDRFLRLRNGRSAVA